MDGTTTSPARLPASVVRSQTEFVSDVNAVVAVGQEVTAWVLSKEDGETKRLALTLKEPRSGDAEGGDMKPAGRGGAVAAKVARSGRQGGDAKAAGKTLSVAKKGDWVEGTVKTVLAFGALVEVEEGVDGLLHISEMSGACVSASSSTRQPAI